MGMETKDLMEALSKKLGCTEDELTEVLKVTVNVISEHLAQNDFVTLSLLGSFKLKKHVEYILKYPDNKQVLYPPRIEVVFVPGTIIKNALERESDE